jgi:hypothetical protein
MSTGWAYEGAMHVAAVIIVALVAGYLAVEWHRRSGV